jgi:FkbM family methyltransferase
LQNGKSVIAFEPMPGNLHHLLSNLKINGWQDRVEVFPIALSDSSGVAEIYGGGTGASLIKGWANVPTEYVTRIPVNTANQVLGCRLNGTRCLILVDIEGAEYRFLNGAKNLLSLTPAPIWLIEITIGEHLPKGTLINPNILATFDIFFDAGYFAWVVSEKIRLVERREVELITLTKIDTLFTHNFIFAKDIDEVNALLGL